jgi:uncharacterized membrane protein
VAEPGCQQPVADTMATMTTDRLEAFSDGVIAILITIMVLELKVPEGHSWQALKPLGPTLLSYVLSFVFLGIYWNNHHHMFQITERVTGSILWANLHLLFWLSLVPFATIWMGENHREPLPTAVYGFVLNLAGVAYFTLSRIIIRVEGTDSRLARAVGRDRKGILSLVLYSAAIAAAWIDPWISQTLFVIVAVAWFVPDRRIENTATNLGTK